MQVIRFFLSVISLVWGIITLYWGIKKAASLAHTAPKKGSKVAWRL